MLEQWIIFSSGSTTIDTIQSNLSSEMSAVIEPDTPPKAQKSQSGQIFVGGKFVDIGSITSNSHAVKTPTIPNPSVAAPERTKDIPVSLQVPDLKVDKQEMREETASPSIKWKPSPTKTKRRPSAFKTFPKDSVASKTSQVIIENLKNIYKAKVLPIEKEYNLYNFCLPTNAEIQDSEFDAKPMVLLLGQYSTGKTTFIRHLVGGDFPAMHIGPEPTTDRFMALINGDKDDSKGRVVKGNSLTVMPELPFSSLSKFGSGFLSHFVGSITHAPLLEHVTLIDTPGVLSGEKQRISRSYDFSKAARWFADRSDLILLLVDAHKLDISDELKDVIEVVRPHNDDKIRCVLNKSDAVTREQLVRVYGSLLWNMGKIFSSPEVIRVYTGSYWDQPLVHDDFEAMFSEDENLLIDELIDLPRSSAERKLNELVKRIRIIKVHVCILSYIKKQMPRWFGKQKAQRRIIQNLEHIFDHVRMVHDLSPGDFPDVAAFTKSLEDQDFTLFPSADRQTMETLDNLILKDIPDIVKGTNGVSVTNVISDHLPESIEISSEKDTKAMQSKKRGSPILLFFGFIFRLLYVFTALYVLMLVLVCKDKDNSLKLPRVLVDHFKKSWQIAQDTVHDPKALLTQLQISSLKILSVQKTDMDKVMPLNETLENYVGEFSDVE